MQIEQGTVDDTDKVFEMTSDFQSPGSGTVTNKRTLFTIVNNDHHRMQTYIAPSGSNELLHMEIEYHRI